MTTKVDIIQMLQRRASAHGGAQCVTCTGGEGFHGPYAEQRCLPIHADLIIMPFFGCRAQVVLHTEKADSVTSTQQTDTVTLVSCKGELVGRHSKVPCGTD